MMFEIILLSSIIFVINVAAVVLYTYLNANKRSNNRDKQSFDDTDVSKQAL